MSCQMRQAHEKLRVPHESFEVVQVQVAKYTTLFDGFLFSYRSTNRHLALWEFSPPGKVGFVINHSKMTIQESTSLASMVNGFLDGFLDEISLSGMISWMVSSRCFQSSLSGWKYHTKCADRNSGKIYLQVAPCYRTGSAVITWNNPKKLEKPCITKGQYVSIFRVDYPM